MAELCSLVGFNRLLLALPEQELKSLSAFLEPVQLAAGEILQYAGDPLRDVYFPENCLISLMTVFENGSAVESGSVGAEGMVGAELCLSQTCSGREARVQIGGPAWRMKTEHFQMLLASQGTRLPKLVKEFASRFAGQAAQLGACNCVHLLNARFARLLLVCSDRTGSRCFKLTHEQIAQMLGTYRPPVSFAASRLKDRKIIGYVRGLISIDDRPALESEACECYPVIRESYREYESFLTKSALYAKNDHLPSEFTGPFKTSKISPANRFAGPSF